MTYTSKTHQASTNESNFFKFMTDIGSNIQEIEDIAELEEALIQRCKFNEFSNLILQYDATVKSDPTINGQVFDGEFVINCDLDFYHFMIFEDKFEATSLDKTTRLNSNYKVEWITLEDDFVPLFKKGIARLSSEKLLHNWYIIIQTIIKSKEHVIVSYSPELDCLLKEVYDQDFPIDRFKKNASDLLLRSPYHRENISPSC